MTQAKGHISPDSVTTSLTRRAAIGATAAALAGGAALNLAAIAATRAAEPDPIFAAIARHQEAFMCRLAASSAYSDTPTFGPDYDEATHKARQEADNEGCERDHEAAMALTTVRPRTLAGVQALLQYVEAFNNRMLRLPSDPENWYSEPFMWPCIRDDDDIDQFSFMILANASAALRVMAVRS